ncbi:hypothetical protein GGI35DRAFT_463252 [Trichoderma velutinum]
MYLPFRYKTPNNRYEALLLSADAADFGVAKDSAQKRGYLLLSSLLCFVLGILAGCTVILVVFFGLRRFIDRDPQPARAIQCSCGSSIDEAMSLGCKYDSLSVSWLPEHCRDNELTEEFNTAGPNGTWSYWADPEGKNPITLEEIALLADLPQKGGVFYSTVRWHLAHCAFSWRKEYRMRAKGLMVEGRYESESHIKHCYRYFVSEEPLDRGNVRSVVWLGGDRPSEEELHDHH